MADVTTYNINIYIISNMLTDNKTLLEISIWKSSHNLPMSSLFLMYSNSIFLKENHQSMFFATTDNSIP